MKKIVIVSNYFNHHQKPLAESFFKITNNNFKFISTKPMDAERIRMGWNDNDKPCYVIEAYIDRDSERLAIKVINEADAVIWGDAPLKYLRERLKKNKLTFRCTERIFKKNHNLKYDFPRAIKHMLLNFPCRKQYLLCMSAYASEDYNRIGFYKNKAFKWGYFPPTKEYNITKLLDSKLSKKTPIILWAARLIDWKHPEIPIQLAKKLKQEGFNFKLQIIGDGILKDDIKEEIKKNELMDCVNLLGAMPPENVRLYMELADIFMCTSDRNEGWGAVLNEAMNSGCAVIANMKIGAAPYLIQDGVNGYMYDETNLEIMHERIGLLLEDKKLRVEIGTSAYETIKSNWNASVAAERFYTFINYDNNEELFNEGILAKETYRY